MRKLPMWQKFRKNNTGTALIESAMVLPFFLVFTFAIIELTRALYMNFELDYALDKTSRYAMVHSNASIDDIKDRLKTELIRIDANDLSTLDVSEVVNADKTKTVNISISYNFQYIVPVLTLPEVTMTSEQTFLRF